MKKIIEDRKSGKGLLLGIGLCPDVTMKQPLLGKKGGLLMLLLQTNRVGYYTKVVERKVLSRFHFRDWEGPDYDQEIRGMAMAYQYEIVTADPPRPVVIIGRLAARLLGVPDAWPYAAWYKMGRSRVIVMPRVDHKLWDDERFLGSCQTMVSGEVVRQQERWKC